MYTKRIAYFSMGSGIYNDMRTYGGGLELLAGDMIWEVIDQNGKFPMYFFHILWKKGYSQQHLTENGDVIDEDPSVNNWQDYVEDTGKKVYVTIYNRKVWLKIWKLKAGPVYYLDAELEENGDFANITNHLYGGSWDNDEKERIAQEIVLGVGGVRAIEALELEVDGYHYNDGHPAFAGLELISQRMELYKASNIDMTDEEMFERAWKHVKARTAFTTHTNVPAGNESHSVDLMMEIGANVGLTKEQVVRIGGNPFGMTVASLKLSSMANGVSRIQVLAAKDMWHWVENAPNIIAITNGVNKRRWQDTRIANAFECNDVLALREAHEKCKSELIAMIKERSGIEFDQNKIIITFARRATEYKRWNLIFRERERFEFLIKECGIQLVFAGKAHRKDVQGKGFITEIYQLSKMYPQNIVFLEGYDIDLAKILVRGSDIWLNNPRVPLEACGTSGMKAAINGTLNLSTLDGWWREAAIDEVNGWNIGDGATDGGFQDEKDAKSLMHVLKYKVIPVYQDRRTWNNMMFASIVTANQYTTGRMVEEYYTNLYNYLKT